MTSYCLPLYAKSGFISNAGINVSMEREVGGTGKGVALEFFRI